jgi:hypothetical protein
MSALAYSFSPRHISEIELLRSISRVTWTAVQEESALAAVAAATLQVPGLTGFRFEPLENLLHLPIYETSKPRLAVPSVSAVATVKANGQTYGKVRIFFDPQWHQALESPVRLAKFIGQQIGIFLHRLDLNREHEKHLSRLEAVERIIRRRKITHRAATVLSEQRNVSETEAIALMVQYARRNQKNLLQIAESLIFGYDCIAFTRPSLRRLAAHETTTTNAL